MILVSHAHHHRCHGNCRYRHLARGAKNKSRELGKPVSGPQSIPSRSGSGRWSGDMGIKLDSSSFSSRGASFDGISPAFPSGVQSFSGSGSGNGFGVADGYSDYSSLPTPGLCLCVCVSVCLCCVCMQSMSLGIAETKTVAVMPPFLLLRCW